VSLRSETPSNRGDDVNLSDASNPTFEQTAGSHGLAVAAEGTL
jgi:hypothetical protein